VPLARTIILTIGIATAFAPAGPTPARYTSGEVPTVPVQTVGGGQVFVELAVSDAGKVTDVKTLRTTPPFTDLIVNAMEGWRFTPAQDTDDPKKPVHDVASTVLVAAVFRPPVLLNGPVAGEPPKDVAGASATSPFPGQVIVPSFPATAMASGTVLVEVDVDPAGAVSDARVIVSAPGLDAAALDAARRWTFRPARLHALAARSVAYLVFGFRQPVT
jgi:TonB family protein